MKDDFPKVKCKRAYKSDGEAAAVKLGQELKIPDKKMQRWLREWSNIRKPKPDVVDDKINRREETEKLLEQRKTKVEIMSGKTKMLAYVLTPGPQQSILYIIKGPESMMRKVQAFSNKAFREVSKPKRGI